ncbi:MAG: type I secretion system permease/ATPase [Desulfobacteraceae bacterium]|nr:type I secretion system permease/ATPase [Desulfobacteraceae bacterium]
MRAFLKKWKKYFVFAGLLSCFINILQLTFTFYMYSIYGNIVTSYSYVSLYSITILALFALAMMGLFTYLRSLLLGLAGVDLNQTLGETVFKNMIRINAFPKKGYSQWLMDLNTVMGFFTSQGLYTIFDLPWAPFYLLFMYVISPALFLVAFIGTAVVFILSVLQNFLTRDRLVKANALYARNSGEVNTLLRNAEVIHSMGMAEGLCRRFDDRNAEIIGNQTIASRYAGVLQSITRPTQVFMQVLIYGVGAYLAVKRELNVGLMIAASIIMGQATGPLMRIMSTWSSILKVRTSYYRLHQFMEIFEMQPDKMRLPRPVGKLTVDHLFFKMDQALLLNNISFSLAPGEILGVIGPSGAGKTTLCKVLVGIWPEFKGKVRLDDVDMFYWDQEELGKHMGYLAQEVELFQTTVSRNIARMGEPDPAKVRKAAEMAGVAELVESLPQGYDTLLFTEDGVSLSGGQKQRMGLARALYNDPAMIVLDEPNSNLDQEGERALMKFLFKMKQTRSATCILVTHKPEILEAVDKILIMKNGQMVQFGDKAEITSKLSAQARNQQRAV